MDYLAMLASGAVGALSKIVSKEIGQSSDYNMYKKTAAINLANSRALAADNDQYQRNLIRDTPMLNKQGMQEAGLSVATLNGGFSSASSNAAQSASAGVTPTSDIDLLGGVSSMIQALVSNQQFDNLQKQSELLDEQVRKQRIENDKLQRDKEDEDKLGRYYDSFIASWNSVKNGLDGEEATITSNREPSYMSKERFEAILGGARISAQNLDVEEKRYSNKLMTIDNENQKLSLDKRQMVYAWNIVQMSDTPELVKAIASIPLKTYQKLEEEVTKIRNENEFWNKVSEFRYQIEKNNFEASKVALDDAKEILKSHQSLNAFNDFMRPLAEQQAKADARFNINQLMAKISDGDWSWKDVVVLLAAGFLHQGGTKLLMSPITK